MQCLHSIPSHLRPTYITRSVESCMLQCTFASHSQLNIVSGLLVHPELFEVFFSVLVLPIHTGHLLSRDILTERIPNVDSEYGDVVSNLLISSTSKFSSTAAGETKYDSKH